jgi:hypothetical protein
MKKIMSLAILASMILSASSSLFADAVQLAVPEISIPASDSGAGTEVKAELSWYSYQHLVNLVTNNPKMSAFLGVSTVVVAAALYKCSWLREFLGIEDEVDAKSPRLNSRLVTAQRAY